MSVGVGARTPIGAIAVLVAVVGGILAGERAGPGPAVEVLLGGGAGVVAAGVVQSTRLADGGRGARGVALPRRSRHAARAPRARRARRSPPRSTSVPTPASWSRWSTTPTRHVRCPCAGPAPRRRRGVLVDRVRRCRRPSAVADGGGVGGAPRLVRAARGIRRTLDVAARGGRVPRHRPRRGRRPPGRRSPGSPTGRGRWCSPDPTHLAPTERALLAGFLLGDTRGVPDAAQRAVPGRGPHAPHRGLGGERRLRARAVRARCCVASACAGGCVAALAVLVCFGTMTRWEPSVLRAIAMAVVALVAGTLGRPIVGTAGAGARGDRPAARRPVPAAPGGLPALVRREPRHRRAGAPIAARLRGPQWLREVLGSTAAAQVGVAPVLSRCSVRCPWSRCPPTWSRSRSPAPLTIWGLAAGVVGGLARPVSPAIPRLLELPTVGLLPTLDLGRRPRGPGAGRSRRPRHVGPRRPRRPPGRRVPRRMLRSTCAGCRYRLGDEVHDLTTRTLVMGILNRTPDSFYDHGATFELDSLLQRAARARRPGRRHPRRRRREGRARARGRRSRGARPRRRTDRRAARTLRRGDLVRHLAGIGARRGVQGRRGRGQRHQRVRRPRLPRGRGHPRRVGGGDPHPAAAARGRSRTALRRSRRRRHRVPARPCRAGRGAPGSPPNRSPSTPVSTSARRPRRAPSSCGRATRSPSTGTRCCSRRRTSASWATLLELELDARRAASLATVAYGVAHGCRIVRVHDVEGSVAVCRMTEALVGARA